MRRHGPVIAHCTDLEDFPLFHMGITRLYLRFTTADKLFAA